MRSLIHDFEYVKEPWRRRLQKMADDAEGYI